MKMLKVLTTAALVFAIAAAGNLFDGSRAIGDRLTSSVGAEALISCSVAWTFDSSANWAIEWTPITLKPVWKPAEKIFRGFFSIRVERCDKLFVFKST